MAFEGLKQFIPDKSATSTNPLPPFSLPKLPEKIRRISPDEAALWEQAVERAVQGQFRALEEKLNVVIDVQK